VIVANQQAAAKQTKLIKLKYSFISFKKKTSVSVFDLKELLLIIIITNYD